MKFLKTALFTTVMSFVIVSCNKNDNDQPTERKFTWTYNGTTYTAKQHTAYMTGIGAPSIIAGLQETVGAPGSGPQTNLTSLQQGSYTITSSGANRFNYIDDGGNILAGTTGSVDITKNTGTALSGSFSVTLSNTKVITGAFENTGIKP
jgi:hypothetical protein